MRLLQHHATAVNQNDLTGSLGRIALYADGWDFLVRREFFLTNYTQGETRHKTMADAVIDFAGRVLSEARLARESGFTPLDVHTVLLQVSGGGFHCAVVYARDRSYAVGRALRLLKITEPHHVLLVVEGATPDMVPDHGKVCWDDPWKASREELGITFEGEG